jgi:hypothetical protein
MAGKNGPLLAERRAAPNQARFFPGYVCGQKGGIQMSEPRTPFADIQASLDKAQRDWINRILTLLNQSQQAAPVGRAILPGGIPAGPSDKPQDPKQQWDRVDPNQKKQQDDVQKAYEKIEAERQIDKQWSFEDALKEQNKNIPPVFQFPARKPKILGPNEHLGVEDKDYAKLPKALKEKMPYEAWMRVSGQRATLFTVFLRLCEYGAWDAVEVVTGIKEKLPGHGQVGSLKFSIYGTGGIAFEEKNAGAIAAILLGTKHFGKDNKLMSILHAGQDSYREWRAEEITPSGVLNDGIVDLGRKSPPPSSSMHVSMGPGKAFDAHIDKISPVNKPDDGQSVPNTDSLKHIRDEVFGPDYIPFVGKIPGVGPVIEKLKPRGVRPDVTMENTSVVPREPTRVKTAWLKFELEWDFPSGTSKKRKKVYNPHPPQLPAPPAHVSSKIADAKALSKRFPRTSENDINAEVLADIIARKILVAAGKGKTSIEVDFPNYINTVLNDAEQKAVHDAVVEIGKIVSEALGAEAGSVKSVTVQIPANGASDVRIKN